MIDVIVPERAAENAPPTETAVFPPTENIGGTETSPPGRPATIEEIKAACAECQAYGNGEGFFGNQWNDRVVGVLLPSYKLLTLVADDPDRLGIAMSQSGVKTTKATLKNPSLICINIAAQPHDTAQRKLCSGWAQILNEARASNVSVERFVAWVGERSERRQPCSSENKSAEPKSTQDPNQLKLCLIGADGPIDEILVLSPATHAALTDALTAPGPRSERVQLVATSLQALADELKANEASVMAGIDLAANKVLTEATDV